MAEQILAALVVLVCAAALVRLCLGERRRQRLDFTLRSGWQRLRAQTQRVWRHRRTHKHAEREAEEAIRRARGKANGHAQGPRSGEDNVIRPDSFKRPRKPH
jgi:hypothetical protein